MLCLQIMLVLRPTEDTLADLLVLISSADPHKSSIIMDSFPRNTKIIQNIQIPSEWATCKILVDWCEIVISPQHIVGRPKPFWSTGV